LLRGHLSFYESSYTGFIFGGYTSQVHNGFKKPLLYSLYSYLCVHEPESHLNLAM